MSISEGQHHKEVKKCRSCGSFAFADILSLGNLHVSNFIDSPSENDVPSQPLDLVICDPEKNGCGLLQLRHTVSPTLMYRNYWYRSGVNKTMTAELTQIANTAADMVRLSDGDLVLDIGANDGTLLRAYPMEKIIRVGFEPARNLMEYARQGTSHIFNDLFSAGLYLQTFGDKKVKAVTAIAMFYDLDDPNAFVADVKKVLHPDGIFIIQMSYLPLMLSQNAFDNACHEHLGYYSLASLEKLLSRHGFEIFDVELNDVNGGSFRTYIRRAGSLVGNNRLGEKRIRKLREEEESLNLHKRQIYQVFASRVEDIRDRLTKFINEEVSLGKKVYVYGASTKGNTLLQYFNLDSRLITAAAERNPIKWGKKTIGTNIPIISEEEARHAMPDYFLVLPWHFLPEFLKREEKFLASGGKFIVPLPEIKIIGKENTNEYLS